MEMDTCSSSAGEGGEEAPEPDERQAVVPVRVKVIDYFLNNTDRDVKKTQEYFLQNHKMSPLKVEFIIKQYEKKEKNALLESTLMGPSKAPPPTTLEDLEKLGERIRTGLKLKEPKRLRIRFAPGDRDKNMMRRMMVRERIVNSTDRLHLSCRANPLVTVTEEEEEIPNLTLDFSQFNFNKSP